MRALALPFVLLALTACPPTAAVSQPLGGAAGAAGHGAGGGGGPTQPTVRWARRYGDAAEQRARGVALDGAGDVLLALQFLGEVSFDDGTMLSASAASDALVAKLSSDGHTAWVRAATGGLIIPSAVAAGPSGESILVGRFNDAITFADTSTFATDPGATNAFAVAHDTGGAVLWSAAAGVGAGLRHHTAVAVDASGAVAIAGHFSGEIDLGPDSLTSDPPSGDDIHLLRVSSTNAPSFGSKFGGKAGESWASVSIDRATGTIALLSESCGGGMCGAAARSIDPHGALLWTAPMSGSFIPTHHAVAALPDGGAVVAGAYEASTAPAFGCGDSLPAPGGSAIYLARFDAAGGCVWSRGLANGAAAFADAVLLIDGGLLLAGSFTGVLDLGGGLAALDAGAAQAVFWAELDLDGNARRAFVYRATGDVELAGAAVSGGVLALAGDLSSTLDLGETTLTTVGGADAFVVLVDR